MRGAVSVAEGAEAGWHRLPPHAARRYAVALLVGFALAAALVVGLTLLTRRLAAQGALDWEAALLARVEGGLLPLSFHSGSWLGAFGSSAMTIPAMVLAALLLMRARRPLEALATPAAYFGGTLLVGLGWLLWDRRRPDLVAAGVAVPELHAFPSGHVAHAITVYGVLALLWTRRSRSGVERALAWLIVAALTLGTAVGRLRIGAHWPTDMIAGAIIGAVWTAAIAVALRRADHVRR